MAHFANLNYDNYVQKVIVVDNQILLDAETGKEIEKKGEDFCKNLFGQDTKWKQTSYNANFRKNYAGIGYYYDEQRDAFIPPKPYNSWILNENTCLWEAPTPKPNDNKLYTWDENLFIWQEV